MDAGYLYFDLVEGPCAERGRDETAAPIWIRPKAEIYFSELLLKLGS
jgi:hypothetical protein